MKKYLLICVLLILMLGFVVQPVMAAEMKDSSPQSSDIQKAKYPPYTDVWDWAAPKEDMPVLGMKLKKMDDGDIMISYHQNGKYGKFKTLSFFGRNNIRDYEAVFKGDYTDDDKSYIPFKDDYVLRKTGGGTRSGGCYDALGFNITIMDKTQIKTLSRKKLLYVYDKPQFYETHPHCMDGPSFYYQVKAVAAKFLSLKDGTFLLVAPEGYVIRFNENFQTKSKLINDKFFWIEESAWLELWKKGDYGDRAEGDMNLKKLYSDLYKLLMTKKGGK